MEARTEKKIKIYYYRSFNLGVHSNHLDHVNWRTDPEVSI